MPANILNLPQYSVLRVDETDHDYHVTAEGVVFKDYKIKDAA